MRDNYFRVMQKHPNTGIHHMIDVFTFSSDDKAETIAAYRAARALGRGHIVVGYPVALEELRRIPVVGVKNGGKHV